jgi:solute carrier family 35 protein E1
MFYVGIWYMGNIQYNLYNKKALNLLGNGRCHWTLAAVQLLVGVLFVIPMWLTGVRSKPELTLDNWKTLFPVGFFSAAAHGFSVLALGAGAVSFGQIVKAGEPVFAAATGAILLKQIDHPIVYAALLPIIAGVGLASLKEMSFTWTALIAASGANQAAALKNVVSKKTMSEPWAKKLGPQNTYAVVTILALLSTIPVALFSDLTVLPTIYKEFQANGEMMNLVKYSIYSGLNFYIYNEFSFLALSKLSPVTHSVANTLKRVVIIVASCIVFNTPMNALGIAGSGIAILGTLLYSLAKKQYGGGGH